MALSKKIISFLKKLGIGIAGFIGLALLGKVFGALKAKDDKQRELAKEALDKTKTSIKKINDINNSSSATISEIKEIIEKSSEDKKEIASIANNRQEELAINAGFVLKEKLDNE
jgi:uncharacterized protein YpuA (DUF1002 family)